MIRKLILLFSIGLCMNLSAQEGDIKFPESKAKLYKFGLQALNDNDLFLSHRYFEKLEQLGMESEDQKYHFNVLLYRLKDYQKALDGFLGLSNNKYSNQLVNYYISLLYSNMNQQKSARDYAMFFIKQKGNREQYPTEYKHISTVKLYLDSFSYKIDTTTSQVYNVEGGVNQSGAEFSPLILPEGILYGSQDMKEVEYFNSKQKKKSKLSATRKIFKAVGKENKFSSISPYPIQSDTLEISSFCFGIDKRLLYITGCAYRDDLKKYKCDLYVSKLKDNVWSPMEKVIELSDPIGSLTHVNMGYDIEKNTPVLYFSSDKPGGRGGFDLYSASYNSRTLKFSGGKNLGGKINTVKDDITPHYHLPTNTLYFSSNGRGGLGGHDVYFAKLKAGIYDEITALDKDINSPQDDVFFTPSKDETKGYMVSNRYSPNSLIHPHCCDDIFYFEKGSKKNNKSQLDVQVIDKKTKELISEFDFKLSRIDSGDISLVETGIGKNGQANLKELNDSSQYEMEVSNPLYYKKKQYIDMSITGNDSLAQIEKKKKAEALSRQLKSKMEEVNQLDIPSEKIKRGVDELMLLYKHGENHEKFEDLLAKLEKIIGDQDRLTSETDLKKSNPESQRAINRELLSAMNQLDEMMKLNLSIHPEDVNELAEIKNELDLAKKLLEEAETAIRNGDFETAAKKQRMAMERLSKAKERLQNLHDKQSKNRNEQAEKDRIRELETMLKAELETTRMDEADKQKIRDMISLHRDLQNTWNTIKNPNLRQVEIELDAIDFNPVILPLVEFDFDSFTLTPMARHIIDSLLVPVLQSNPKLKIELGAHTDSRGKDEYNESLSEKRARAIRFYLIDARGIYPERLTHKGYGEYAPIAPNENPDGTDNPEGRQRNRRCEFRILKEIYDPY